MGAFHCLQPPVDIQLAVDILDMRAHRIDGYIQLGGDFITVQAGIEQAEYLKLSIAQRFDQKRCILLFFYPLRWDRLNFHLLAWSWESFQQPPGIIRGEARGGCLA